MIGSVSRYCAAASLRRPLPARAAAQSQSRRHQPADQAKRILAGEHPLRVWREHRVLTMTALAAMKMLAAALELTADDLML